jgi:digeranylgeranylglycerophospholipid reductase
MSGVYKLEWEDFIMHDVAVVGAGPAGLRCAGLCEKSGLDVLVVDRKPEIGLPVQCSGLISRNLDRLVRVPESCIEHRVRGALVHGPDGREVRLEKPGTAAYVIDRSLLDRFLARQARSEIRMKTGVRKLRYSRDCVKLATNKGDIEALAVLGCDGPSSVVAGHFGQRPRELLQGVIMIEEKPDRSSFVELWLDRKICDGFLWRIPRGESVEYGMLGSRAGFRQLEGFFGVGEGLEKRAGLVPIGPGKTHFDRTLLVGDAAAQTKPWSGGGVVYGLTAAGHAARTLKEALDRGDLSEQALGGYEQAWRTDLERPIQMGLMAREFYMGMDNRQLGEVLDKLASMELNSLDMDFPALGFL